MKTAITPSRRPIGWAVAAALLIAVFTQPGEVGFTRGDVEFSAAGTTPRGWLYRPESATGDVPIIVLSQYVARCERRGRRTRCR